MIFQPNHEHSFTILYEEGDNKVIYCEECQAFHVYYGTFSLDASMSAMESLLYTLAVYLKNYEGRVHPKCRCIEIDTPFPKFRLLMSTDDLHCFGRVLGAAYKKFKKDIWTAQNN
ncbi:MAG: hypothetical protein AAGI23_22590 [Bacteroidota bacterium]